MNLNFQNVEWGPVAGQLMKIGAPMVGTIIGGPAGAIAGGVIGSLASMLEVDPTPEAVSAKLQDPAVVEQVKAFEDTNRESLAIMVEKTSQVQIEQTNLSLRAEITSGDRFQRWARPFNMYAVGGVTACYGLCCVAAAINTIFTRDPTALVHVTNLGGSLVLVLTPAGAVAGVTAWQQTKEKLAGVVQRPPPAATVPGKTSKR